MSTSRGHSKTNLSTQPADFIDHLMTKSAFAFFPKARSSESFFQKSPNEILNPAPTKELSVPDNQNKVSPLVAERSINPKRNRNQTRRRNKTRQVSTYQIKIDIQVGYKNNPTVAEKIVMEEKKIQKKKKSASLAKNKEQIVVLHTT